MFRVPVYGCSAHKHEEDELYLSYEQLEQLADWIHYANDSDLAPDIGYWLRLRGVKLGTQQATLLVLVEPARDTVRIRVCANGAEYEPDRVVLSKLLGIDLIEEREEPDTDSKVGE